MTLLHTPQSPYLSPYPASPSLASFNPLVTSAASAKLPDTRLVKDASGKLFVNIPWDKDSQSHLSGAMQAKVHGLAEQMQRQPPGSRPPQSQTQSQRATSGGDSSSSCCVIA